MKGGNGGEEAELEGREEGRGERGGKLREVDLLSPQVMTVLPCSCSSPPSVLPPSFPLLFDLILLSPLSSLLYQPFSSFPHFILLFLLPCFLFPFVDFFPYSLFRCFVSFSLSILLPFFPFFLSSFLFLYYPFLSFSPFFFLSFFPLPSFL